MIYSSMHTHKKFLRSYNYSSAGKNEVMQALILDPEWFKIFFHNLHDKPNSMLRKTVGYLPFKSRSDFCIFLLHIMLSINKIDA